MTKIETEAEYDAALARCEALFHAPVGSPEEKELMDVARMLNEYEAIHHPIDPPDPIEAIKFRKEQEGPRELMARLIAEVGGAEKSGKVVYFNGPATPSGDIIVHPNRISVTLFRVSSFLALEIARLVREERAGDFVLGETTLAIGSSEDTPDGIFVADEEIHLDGPVGINKRGFPHGKVVTDEPS